MLSASIYLIAIMFSLPGIPVAFGEFGIRVSISDIIIIGKGWDARYHCQVWLDKDHAVSSRKGCCNMITASSEESVRIQLPDHVSRKAGFAEKSAPRPTIASSPLHSTHDLTTWIEHHPKQLRMKLCDYH